MVGKQFEKTTKKTVEVEDDLTKDIDYLKYKGLQLEKDVFFLNPKQ